MVQPGLRSPPRRIKVSCSVTALAKARVQLWTNAVCLLLVNASWRPRLPRLPAWLRAALTNEGVDLAGYGLPQQVDDLEAARRALGYPCIDFVEPERGAPAATVRRGAGTSLLSALSTARSNQVNFGWGLLRRSTVTS